MYDYGTMAINESDVLASGAFAGIMAMGAVFYIIALLVGIFSIVCMWKVFTKAGKPGWASIIPIYNMVVMFQIAGMSPWMILLMLVPIANVIVAIMLYINFAKAFGKSGAFAVGLIFLNIIFMAILAFDSSEYVGE